MPNGDDQNVYLVVDDLGRNGRIFVKRTWRPAALTMAAVPFTAMTLLVRPKKGIRPMAESIFAGVFLVAAIYAGLNEGPDNWQSLWTCAAYVLLAVTLWRARGGECTR